MKKFSIFIVVIWAFGLILLPHSGDAEMNALTDEQMGEGYLVNTWNFSLKIDLEGESDAATEGDDLFDDIEETKLNTSLREDFILNTEKDFDIYEISVDRETTEHGRVMFDGEMQFKSMELNIYRHGD